MFLVGIAFGYFQKGRQDKSQLFKTAFVIGLVVALVLGVLGWLVGAPALGVGGILGALVAAAVLALLFILGVWLGDVLEGRRATSSR